MIKPGVSETGVINFEDFDNIVGKNEITLAIKQAYGSALATARNTIDALLFNKYAYRDCPSFQLEGLKDFYVKLAEAEYYWRVNADNFMDLLLVGLSVTKLTNEIKELKKTLKKEVEENESYRWEELDEEENYDA